MPAWAPYLAIWRVEELLRKVTEALNDAKVPYAVVGGNAVAAWVSTVDDDAVRATKDVDILARRSDLAEMRDALLKIGLIQTEVLGVTIFVERENPSPKRGLHVVIANEIIRPHYRHPAPDTDARVSNIAPYSVVDLPSLVAMKLQSFRPIDQAHIVDLKGVGLITSELIAGLPEDLRAKMAQIPEPDTH